MAIFLKAQDVYRLLQRELPEGVYADGTPSGSFTAASIYAKAVAIESLYSNLERIYTNNFPQEADERIHDWEIKAFGYYLPDSLSLADRQKAIVNKLRQRPGINLAAIQDIVRTQLGNDAIFNVIAWNCCGDATTGCGGWVLDESQLDIDTYLNIAPMTDVTPSLYPNANFCINDPAFGKTDQEWADMQTQAYTYEVQIYGQTLTTDERTALDLALSKGEPARSAHVITDGLDPNDIPNGEN